GTFIMNDYISKSQGECPVCKSHDINYDTFVYEGDYLYYPIECNECGNIGKEYYTLVYDMTSTRIDKKQTEQILKQTNDK
ncbi:hypothetical protein DRO61_06765, partial [Candidatus Bathyarchaeota archaeon]